MLALLLSLLLSIVFIIVGFCSHSPDPLALPAGAHMNAAVTFTNCALGRMPWKKFPVYVLGQFLGSFLAAATIYGLFYSEFLSLGCPFLAPAPSSEIWADPTSGSWPVKMSGRESLGGAPHPSILQPYF